MLDEGYFVEYIDSDDEDHDGVDHLLESSKGSRSRDKSGEGEKLPLNPFVIKMREALARMFQKKLEEAKMKEKRIRHQMR